MGIIGSCFLSWVVCIICNWRWCVREF